MQCRDITIINDNSLEPSEDFNVTLSNIMFSGGPAMIGEPSTAVVNIEDSTGSRLCEKTVRNYIINFYTKYIFAACTCFPCAVHEMQENSKELLPQTTLFAVCTCFPCAVLEIANAVYLFSICRT